MSNPGWRWSYPTGWCRSTPFSGVRHWVLIGREVRRGVWKLSVGLWRKGAKEGVKMTTTTLARVHPILSFTIEEHGMYLNYLE